MENDAKVVSSMIQLNNIHSLEQMHLSKDSHLFANECMYRQTHVVMRIKLSKYMRNGSKNAFGKCLQLNAEGEVQEQWKAYKSWSDERHCFLAAMANVEEKAENFTV